MVPYGWRLHSNLKAPRTATAVLLASAKISRLHPSTILSSPEDDDPLNYPSKVDKRTSGMKSSLRNQVLRPLHPQGMSQRPVPETLAPTISCVAASWTKQLEASSQELKHAYTDCQQRMRKW